MEKKAALSNRLGLASVVVGLAALLVGMSSAYAAAGDCYMTYAHPTQWQSGYTGVCNPTAVCLPGDSCIYGCAVSNPDGTTDVYCACYDNVAHTWYSVAITPTYLCNVYVHKITPMQSVVRCEKMTCSGTCGFGVSAVWNQALNDGNGGFECPCSP
jgi:hypothetical protein